MADKIPNVKIENARVAFRNFSGEEGKFNPAGKMNFCILLDDAVARGMSEDGWNIKYLTPRNEEDEPQAYIQVAVSYENIPPKVFMVTERGQTLMDEDTIHILDWAELSNVDVIIRPYSWEVNGRSGIKAYLKTGYFTIVEDDLEKKYANIPDTAAGAMVYEADVPFE